MASRLPHGPGRRRGIPYDTVVQVALTPVAYYTLGTDFKPGPRADADGFAHWNRW
ncbi:hypothetical protein ACQP2C_00855 [Micromonospora zamorensis]|uniref:hypothetical protein n=1 Tax=Micromonospora zamorensis TaxID=709883 RepID=UPI003D98E32A